MLKRIVRGTVDRLYRLSILGLTTGEHITRYYTYKHLRGFAETRPEDQTALSISGSGYLAELLGYRKSQITNAPYPEYNVLDLAFDDNSFDLVVSDYVLEHVAGNPQVAIDEMFRILKPGGTLLLTTVLVFPLHAAPNDYWRFTPDALRLLTAGHGEIIDAGGWGNPFVWLAIAIGLSTQPIPHARWHPAHWIATKNSNNWIITTWVLARKRD